MSEKLSERFAALFMRHHRDSCYPTAMPFEAEAFADEAVALLAEQPPTDAAGMRERAATRGGLDVVERLRWDTRYTYGHVPVTMEDAAMEIERLRSLSPSPTADALRVAEEALDSIETWLDDPQHGTINYVEGPGLYDDLEKFRRVAHVALAAIRKTKEG